MSRKNRTPEEKERRARIRELLQLSNVGSMDDIQSLFKESIAEFLENGLEAELDEELGYSKYDYKNKDTDNSRNGHSDKRLRTSFGDIGGSVPRGPAPTRLGCGAGVVGILDHRRGGRGAERLFI